MKKANRSRWQNLTGIPVQYYLEEDYFEIRGRIPEHMSYTVFLDKIVRSILSLRTRNLKYSVSRKNTEGQQDLFKKYFDENLLKNVPILSGDKSLKKSLRKQNNDVIKQIYRVN
jgi:hypothetical protein